MGSSKSSTDSTSTTNQSASVSPTNPGWVTNGIGTLGTSISNLAGLDPYSLVSGPTTSQQTAAGIVNGQLGGLSNTALDTAGATLTGELGLGTPTISNGGGAASMTAASLLPNIQSYMSPYINDVTSSAMKSYDDQAGRTMAGQKLSNAGADATFGGSNSLIGNALTSGQLALGRSSTLSGLLNSGFQEGATLANEDADRQQQANQTNAQLQEAANARALQASEAQAQAQATAQQYQQNAATGLANVGTAIDSNLRANATTSDAIGDDLRSITQQQNLAPISMDSALAGLWGSLPLTLFHGTNSDGSSTTTSNSTTTQTPSMLQDIGGLAGAAGSVMTGLGAMGGLGGLSSGLSGLLGGGASSGVGSLMPAITSSSIPQFSLAGL